MIAKYIVLSNIISVAQIIFCVYVFRNTIKKVYSSSSYFISIYNSLLVRYKNYLSDSRECLYTTWRYAEAYENFSIDPTQCRKNPIKKINLSYQLSALITRRKLHWNKSVTAKVCLENFVRHALKENKLWNRTFKSAFW